MSEEAVVNAEIALNQQIYGIQASPTIGKLAKALAKAQLEFDKVRKDTINPFFKSKYADLATVIDATRKALADNEIAVVQSPQLDHTEKLIVVTTMLIHSSGEWIAGDLALPFPTGKYDPQAAGSAITYARRYARQAFVDVSAELDDDANAATDAKGRESFEEAVNDTGIAEFQVNAFNAACDRTNKTAEQIKAYLYGLDKVYTHPKDLAKSQFKAALAWANATLPSDAQTTKEAPKPQSSGATISAAQEKRLWAIGKSKGFSEDEIRAVVGRHGFEHVSEIPWKAYDAICKDLEGGK